MSKRVKYDLLPNIAPGSRPSVLLVGNGIVRAFDEDAKMEALIRKAWKESHPHPLPEGDHPIWKLPFPMQIIVASKDHVQDCMSGLAGDFMAADTFPDQEVLIQKLLNTGFDTVLSTNYSLEFEKTTFPAFSEGKVKSSYRVTTEQTNNQERFGIFQCTELPYGSHPTLWHIHGTAIRKTSLVMGHHYYGKLLTEVTQRAEKTFKIYMSAQKTNSVFHPLSWIDYFLVGDVYIVGFSLDPSEMDIWWLLSYKKLFEDSKVFFYEPHISEEKKLLLDCYNVNAPAIPIKQKDGKEDYIEYYNRVFDYIKSGKPMGD